MNVSEVQAGFLDLATRLYSAEETAAHRGKFKATLKRSPNFGLLATCELRCLAARIRFWAY
jgi:hypothetical protein